MIGNSLLTQIIVAAVAIGIVITFIQPKLASISDIEAQIETTNKEIQSVEEVNNTLDRLYADFSSVPEQNKKNLTIYLPDAVDEVQVLKDLTAMTSDARVEVGDLSFNEGGVPEAQSSDLADNPFPYTFSLSFNSSYTQLKDFLGRLEQNNYPLQIQELSITPTEGGFLDASFELVTYSHKE